MARKPHPRRASDNGPDLDISSLIDVSLQAAGQADTRSSIVVVKALSEARIQDIALVANS